MKQFCPDSGQVFIEEEKETKGAAKAEPWIRPRSALAIFLHRLSRLWTFAERLIQF